MKSANASHGRPAGLPVHALTLGVDRVLDACPRRWWFRKGEGLREREEARALSYGTAWHAVLDDVHRWWERKASAPYPWRSESCPWCLGDDDGCSECHGTGLAAVERIAGSWVGTDREEDGEILRRALEGWAHKHGDTPPNGWKVLAIECAIVMPIPSMESEGRATYTPTLCWVTAPDGTTRLARTGEALPGRLPPGWRMEWLKTPAFLSLRLDVLWSDLRSVWVQEHKSSGDPRRYISGLAYDPQVTLYELAAAHGMRTGQIPSSPRGAPLRLGEPPPVAGWLYDVTSSHKQSDPKPLKEGGFSVAKTLLGNVPSWRLRSTLEAAGISASDLVRPPKPPKRKKGDPEILEPVFDPDADTRTWDDVIVGQSEVDAKLYVREYGRSGAREQDRALRESYAAARRAAALHRAAANTMPNDDAALDVAFPRVSLCRQPGSWCAFRGPCIQDGPQAREAFTVSNAPDWGVPAEEDTD